MSTAAAPRVYASPKSSPRSIRVLFVVPGDGQGSSMIFVRRQAEALAVEGVHVDLFYLGSRTSPMRIGSEFRRFRREVAGLRPAIVHAHFGTATALFAAIAAGSLPLVITYRGSDLNPPPASYGWSAKVRAVCGLALSHVAALRAQKIICVSRQLRQRLWWKRSIHILPTGVDCETFCPEPRTLARRRLGWSERETVILFHAGHDVLVKRLDLAQAAFRDARRMVPSLQMRILDGSISPDLVPAMMNASDCLLLTSAWEGSPTVVQEALACDLPIVSVAVGDVIERLEGVANSTVAGADAGVLGRALVRMVDPPRRSNGRAKSAEFCAQHIAQELRDLYLDIVGGQA